MQQKEQTNQTILRLKSQLGLFQIIGITLQSSLICTNSDTFETFYLLFVKTTPVTQLHKTNKQKYLQLKLNGVVSNESNHS